MNSMPPTWLDELKREYPQRSGPMRWPRVFLPVRRALQETTWDELIAGVKRYAEYCKASGKEGSDYVSSPENFFKDEIYNEVLVWKAPEKPEVIESRNKEADRWRCAREAAGKLSPPLEAMPGESVGSFETRISLGIARGPSRQIVQGSLQADIQGRDTDLASRISSLAERMRVKNG